MTLRLRVVARMGRPIDRPITADVPEEGGTIGRAPDCTLVLPDPGRHISRQQARLSRRGGGWQVHSVGTSNPLLVNGSELEPGRSTALADGDRITIAEYEIEVEDPQARSAAMPSPAGAADPMPGPAPTGSALMTPAQVIADDFDPFAAFDPQLPAGVDPAWQDRARRPDGDGEGHGQAPSDHPLATPPPSFSDDPFAPDSRARRAGGADLLGPGGSDARILDHGRRSSEDLDALFGLKPGGPQADPLGGRGFIGDEVRAGSPAGQGAGQRAGSNAPAGGSGRSVGPGLPLHEVVDPLEAIGGGARNRESTGQEAARPAAPMSDHASALSGAMKLPAAIPVTTFGLPSAPPGASGEAATPRPHRPLPEPGPDAPSRAGPQAPPERSRARGPGDVGDPFAPPDDMPAAAAMPSPPRLPSADALGRAVMSWEPSAAPAPPQARPQAAEPSSRAPARVAATVPVPIQAPVPVQASTPIPAPTPVSFQAPVPVHSPVPAQPFAQGQAPAIAPVPTDAPTAELVAAFLRGAGLSDWPRAAAPALTPASMERLGQLLRASTEGTVALLGSRQTLKREMRAEVTSIGATHNNPLKFAPDPLSALVQLLADPPIRGFMPGPVALRDAHDDLLAHQVAFVAGVRAAMQGLIARFDPVTLEERLARKGGLAARLPGRRARLWDLFVERFGELSAEAGDDFDRLFGEAFVAAYEEQVRQLARGPGTDGDVLIRDAAPRRPGR